MKIRLRDDLPFVEVTLDHQNPLRRIRGVGGSEFVFIKTLDRLTVGALSASAFTVEVGALDYG